MDLLAASEERKEREAGLNEAREALSKMDSKVSRAEEDAQTAWEATEKIKEEAARSREQAALVEEAASKAREEAARYKGLAAELDKEKRLIESNLVAARDAFHGIKKEHLSSELARGATEEAGKKARDDLEAQRTRSRGLSDDVDHLKRMLREKEEVILHLGKMIEDLRVKNTDLAPSYKEIERVNTDLVGENTALEEKVHGEFLMLLRFFRRVFLFCRLTLL